MSTGKFNFCEVHVTMQWTRIPSGARGSRNTPSFAPETGITANLKGHLAHILTLLPLQSLFICFIYLFTNFAKDKLAGEISQNYCFYNETPKHAKKNDS